MIWFKSKRRIADLERLVTLLQKEIKAHEERKPNYASSFINVPPPSDDDLKAFALKIEAFVNDPLYLFYFVQLRREIVDAFEVGQVNAEFSRGELAIIGKIFNDARKARGELGQE